MSHVAKVDLKIKDLAALKMAAQACGLEFVQGATSYKWWGYSVGGYPLPEGFTASDLGKCDHKLKLKDAHAGEYEVGVVKAKSGDGYVLLFDFFGQSRLLAALGGEQGGKLKQEYGAAVAQRHYMKQGYRVSRSVDAQGRVVLSARK